MVLAVACSQRREDILQQTNRLKKSLPDTPQSIKRAMTNESSKNFRKRRKMAHLSCPLF